MNKKETASSRAEARLQRDKAQQEQQGKDRLLTLLWLLENGNDEQKERVLRSRLRR